MATYTDIIQHPDYQRRVETQFRSLLTMDRIEMAKYAAESYAYWSLRAILTEREMAEDAIAARRSQTEKGDQ